MSYSSCRLTNALTRLCLSYGERGALIVKVLLSSLFPHHSTPIPASTCLDIPPKDTSLRPRPLPRARYPLRSAGPALAPASTPTTPALLTLPQFSTLVLQPFIIGSLIQEDEQLQTGVTISFEDALELARETESIGSSNPEHEEHFDGLELSADKLALIQNERKLQEWIKDILS